MSIFRNGKHQALTMKRIEEEIQQSSFRNEYQKAVVNLIFTYNWFTDKMKDFLAPSDLTIQQYNVLRILRGSAPKPLTTSEIRERMLDKNSDASRIVDRLVKKALAHKCGSANDRRLVDVRITEKGLSLLEQLDQRGQEMDNLIDSLGTDDAAQLNQLLDKMRG